MPDDLGAAACGDFLPHNSWLVLSFFRDYPTLSGALVWVALASDAAVGLGAVGSYRLRSQPAPLPPTTHQPPRPTEALATSSRAAAKPCAFWVALSPPPALARVTSLP